MMMAESLAQQRRVECSLGQGAVSAASPDQYNPARSSEASVMTYVVEIPTMEPHAQSGRIPGWEQKVPDPQARAEISSVFREGGRLLCQQEVPDVLELLDNPRPIPNAFVTYAGMMIVGEVVRNIIEYLEKGLHQFFPIEVHTKDNGVVQGRFFVFNVYTCQSSIVDQESDVTPHFMCKSSHEIMYINYSKKKISVKKSSLSNVNIWRENRYPGALLISDMLEYEMLSKGVSFFRLWPAIET